MQLFLIDWKELDSRATEIAQRLGVNFDVKTPVSELTSGEQQEVEIAQLEVERTEPILHLGPDGRLVGEFKLHLCRPSVEQFEDGADDELIGEVSKCRLRGRPRESGQFLPPG